MPTRSLLAAVVATAVLVPAVPAVPAAAAPGDLDPVFGEGGVALLDGRGEGVSALLALPDGGAIAVDDSFDLSRLDAGGSEQAGWGKDLDLPIGSGTYAYDAARDAQGRVVVAGEFRPDFDGRQVLVARVGTDGALDPTFGDEGVRRFDFPGGAADTSRATAVAIDAAGRIVVAGTRVEGPGSSSLAVARLLDDGGFDPAFSDDGSAMVDVADVDEAEALALDPTGDLVLAGRAAEPDGSAFRMAVARLDADGTPDATFSGDGVATPSIAALGDDAWSEGLAVGVDAQRRVVVGGSAFNSDDTAAVVTRLTADGGVDAGFADRGAWVEYFGTFSSEVVDLGVRPDGAVVAAGFAEGVSQETGTDGFVTRLTPAGAPDARFAAAGTRFVPYSDGDGNDEVSALALWPDGRMLAAGSTQAGGFFLRAAVSRIEGLADPVPVEDEDKDEDEPVKPGPTRTEDRGQTRTDPPARTLPLPVPSPGPQISIPPRASVGPIAGRSPRRFSGAATGSPARVEVALVRRAGRRCSAVRSTDARLVKAPCARPRWMKARGTARWSLALRRGLPRGRYELLARPVAADGTPGTATRRSFRVA